MRFLAGLVLLAAVALCAADSDIIGFPQEEDGGPPRRPPPTVPPTAPAPAPDNPGVDAVGALIGCNCPSTPEFNLVCGTDGNTYGNMGKLRCAQRCGHKVEVAFLGNCRNRPS